MKGKQNRHSIIKQVIYYLTTTTTGTLEQNDFDFNLKTKEFRENEIEGKICKK